MSGASAPPRPHLGSASALPRLRLGSRSLGGLSAISRRHLGDTRDRSRRGRGGQGKTRGRRVAYGGHVPDMSKTGHVKDTKSPGTCRGKAAGGGLCGMSRTCPGQMWDMSWHRAGWACSRLGRWSGSRPTTPPRATARRSEARQPSSASSAKPAPRRRARSQRSRRRLCSGLYTSRPCSTAHCGSCAASSRGSSSHTPMCAEQTTTPPARASSTSSASAAPHCGSHRNARRSVSSRDGGCSMSRIAWPRWSSERRPSAAASSPLLQRLRTLDRTTPVRHPPARATSQPQARPVGRAAASGTARASSSRQRTAR
mmetsp:Transcript_13787/g.44178  ORF Transcript_13787/g.44178 Transcript_13787/m.44178 type:complete len:313 (+) Transcript_13787:191-1129(+)